MSFEQSIKRIEEIVSQLETGELTLEKSVELYHEGIGLAVSCKNDLEASCAKIGKAGEADGS